MDETLVFWVGAVDQYPNAARTMLQRAANKVVNCMCATVSDGVMTCGGLQDLTPAETLVFDQATAVALDAQLLITDLLHAGTCNKAYAMKHPPNSVGAALLHVVTSASGDSKRVRNKRK